MLGRVGGYPVVGIVLVLAGVVGLYFLVKDWNKFLAMIGMDKKDKVTAKPPVTTTDTTKKISFTQGVMNPVATTSN